MTVLTGWVSSVMTPRLKSSVTNSGRVLSKQLKETVARKKVTINNPIFGWESV